MTDKWIEFFRIITIASGTRLCAVIPYKVAAKQNDAYANGSAKFDNMLPLPGGRGDLGCSELAEQFIKESTA